MKIAYLVHQFYPEFYTPTEKLFFNLSRMMQKAGSRVKVITYSFYPESFYDQHRGEILCREFLYRGIPVLAIRHKQLPDDLNHTIGNKALAEIAGDLIRAELPDVVHVGHTMRVGALAQVLPSLRIPYVLTLTDFFLVCPKVNLVPSGPALCDGPEQGEACARLCPELQSDFIDQRLESAREILVNAQMLAAASAFAAGAFTREFPGLDVKVVRHGLGFEGLKRNQRTYASGDRIVFCYAGSFDHHKGLNLLLEAFKAMQIPNASLRIYGSESDKSDLDNLMAIAGANENIQFCGVYSEDEPYEILNGVDVLVIPSLCHESYSMILHGALACNVPVVATALGCLAENIKDGFNGFLFSRGNSAELQTVLRRIVQDPAVLNPLKRNISSMIIQGVEEEAYAYARVYRSAKIDRGCRNET
jgi:glycosyltransferase involved in cell wall biosynthesis